MATNESKTILRMYYLPLSFPCGPQSSCCGPTGQSDEEIRAVASQLETHLPGVEVQTIDVTGTLDVKRDRAVVKLLNAFGGAACPMFALNGEVLSMGTPAVSELASLVRLRLPATRFRQA